MSDLISREALLEVLRGLKPSGFEQSIAGKVAIRLIEAAPAVDAEPVRHGKWGECHITGYDGLHAVYTRPCSECGHEARFRTRYCPVCGAKMDEEEEI